MDSKAISFTTRQAIFSSVRSGDLDELKKLVEEFNKDESLDESAVCDIMSMHNDAGETALYLAAEHNCQEEFSHWLRFCNFEVVKIRSTKSDMNAFQIAAKRGHLDIVKELLSNWPV